MFFPGRKYIMHAYKYIYTIYVMSRIYICVMSLVHAANESGACFSCFSKHPPKNGEITLSSNTLIARYIMFHKNKMCSTIRTSGAIFYSLSYFNSRVGFNGPKYLYSVVSVIDTRLPVNNKKWAIAPFVDDQSAISCILGGYEPCAT